MIAPLPHDEDDRLTALRSYRILDTAPEPAFDGAARLAAQVCGTPIALITLIDHDRQWFKASVGVAASETPRDVSICAHTILGRDILEVYDLTVDARFADIPPVADAQAPRFYAGAPLVTPDGRAVGTVCVMDMVPRTLTAEQRETLRTLAEQVVVQLELRRHAAALGRALEERAQAEARLHAQFSEAARYQSVLRLLAEQETSDLDAALRTILRADAEALSVERVSAWFFDDNGRRLVCRTLFTGSDGQFSTGAFLEAAQLPRYFAALQERRVIAAHDAPTDPATSEFAEDYLKPLGITSMLDVPIWRHGAMHGVVCHEHTGSPRQWTAAEQDFAASIADMISLSMEAFDRNSTELELHTTAHRMRAVAAAASGVIGARSRAELRTVLEEACRNVVPFDAFFILRYDPVAHTFQGFGGRDAGEDSPPNMVSALGTPGERVIRERRSLVTQHADDPASAGATLTGTMRRSESIIRTPILRGDEVLGMLSAQSYTPDRYTAEDVEVIEAVASLAATALSNIDLLSERERTTEALRKAEREAHRTAGRMRAVAAAAAGVIGAHSLEALQEVLRQACRMVIRFDAFTFSLYDAQQHTFSHLSGLDGDIFIPPDTIPAAGVPAERVVRERRSLVTLSSADPAAAGAPLLGTGRRSESIIRAPILSGECVLGVLAVHSYTPGLYTDQDVEVIEAICSLAANALSNINLAEKRRRAEDALRASEASYRALFDSSNDAIYVHDLETGALLDVNRAACAVHGYSEEELVREGIRLLGTGEAPYTAAEAAEYLRRAAIGEPQHFEWRVRHRSGRLIWVEVKLQRVTIDGTPRLLATTRDIEDRKRAEAALQQAYAELERRVEERTAELARANLNLRNEVLEREAAEQELLHKTSELEGVFQALPDLYFRLRSDGTIADYHAGPGSALFLPPREFLGRRIQEVVPVAAGREYARALDVMRASREIVSIEYTLGGDGNEHNFEARLVPLLEDQVITVVREITDRKRAEVALKRSEEHFRSIIDNISDVISIIDVDGVVHYQSPSMERVLGWKAHELLGRNVFEHVHPDDVALAAARLRSVVETPGVTNRAVFRFQHADGGWRTLEGVGRTLSPDSAEEGIVVNSRDITERRRNEEALRQAKDEAERAREAAESANRAKSEFLSRMSHELRTPMNSILGFGQLMARKELPADQRKAVDHILKAGQHLLNLINEVLDIARIEANRQQLSLEPVRLRTSLFEAVSLIRPLAALHGCIVVEDPELAGDDPFVHADRQRLAQVLLNLLSNAVKYNVPGGRVWLSSRTEHDSDGATARVRVGVHDTGPGIPLARRDEMFVPFSRLGAEQTEVEGTGLGLALSKRLMEAMGGDLEFETELGQGSTFWLSLAPAEPPVAHLRSRPIDERAAVAPSSLRDARILYIEDNLANFSLIEAILASRPAVRLIPALQGSLGLDLAWEHRPDLILLDLHLPDIPGEEVLRRLRSDERTRETPVIVISADAMPGSVTRLLGAGAAAYVKKPIDVDAFLAELDRILAPRVVTA